MPRKTKVKITTQAQRDALAMLRNRLGEKGYYIFEVAPLYRCHHLDFVAVPKNVPQQLVLIAPKPGNRIIVRPLSSPALYDELKMLLAECRKLTGASLHWSRHQLWYRKKNPDGWMQYLSKQSRNEYRRLES